MTSIDVIMLVAPAFATRLVLAGVSGSTFFILIIMSILRKCILYVGQINEHSYSDSDSVVSC